jgi:hypothetical protein
MSLFSDAEMDGISKRKHLRKQSWYFWSMDLSQFLANNQVDGMQVVDELLSFFTGRCLKQILENGEPITKFLYSFF